MGPLETDYLVIGAGAAGMAFTDSLITHSDADVVMVDRRHRPGGHWNDAYPFVRLHAPSATYGVNSRVLGSNKVDQHGPNAGFYERATAAEICDYFDNVLEEQLLPSGRVRLFGMCDYQRTAAGEHRFVSRLTGAVTDVVVRRKVVDATYLETKVPSTHVPSFPVDVDARLIPVNSLVDMTEPPGRYVVLGAGKTAMDACTWLLDNGVDPDRIRWIRPRDAWVLDRAGLQPLDHVASIMEGLSLDLEAAAGADSLDDLLRRLEERGRLQRLDASVVPTMYRCAILSQAELAQLRQVTDVVRRGRVLRVDSDQIVLDHGTVDLAPGDVAVDCTAAGIAVAPARPIFEPDRITLQQIRACSPPFNAALTGYVEAARTDPVEQNGLCPSTPYPTTPGDWVRVHANSLQAAAAWRAEPDVDDWVNASRLNLFVGFRDHLDEPRMQQALARYLQHLEPATVKLQELLGSPVPARGARSHAR